jgi:hypothetical protein
MPVIDDVINYITNDLNIKISNKKRDQIIDKFYPDIKNKVYWSISVSCRVMDFFYEGMISKEEYEEIKLKPPKTSIYFGSHAKYVDEDGCLDELSFSEDIQKLKKFYDKGGENSNNYFDLMGYLNDKDD